MSVRWDAKQGAVVSYGDDMVKPAPLTTETLMTAMPGGAIAAVNSDGTTEHEDTYFRQIDGKLMEISIEYTGDRQATIDQILSAIEQAR